MKKMKKVDVPDADNTELIKLESFMDPDTSTTIWLIAAKLLRSTR
jgi:hypothetical protein